MKKYLKNQEGMALPMVLFIMAILMTLATCLALFAYNSLLSVRWMDDEKKAYYLSQAGVEAANQAYQSMLAVKFGTAEGGLTTEQKNIALSLVAESEEEDAILKTATVYLAYSDENGTNSGTLWQGLHFTQTKPSDFIGYFTVEIGNGTDTIIQGKDDSGKGVEVPVDVKVYKSVATVGEVTRTVFAYVTPPDFTGSGTSEPLYNDDGVLNKIEDTVLNGSAGKTYTDTATTKGFSSVTVDKFDPQTVASIKGGGLGNFFKRLANGIIMKIFEILFPNYERPYATYLKTAEGNLILTEPANSDTISCNENQDNFYVFATSENLFVQGCGIDATPTKGYYAGIGLYGKDIVVDGDITMYAYIPKRNLGGLNINFLTSLVGTFGNRYRLGTVIMGNGSSVAPTKTDTRNGNEGGLKVIGTSASKNLPVNRIFFNGNVYLKIEEQGSAVETYRVFESGDIAYFYGMYNMTSDATGENEGKEASGIDLTKFFIDAVLAGADGYNNYSERTRQRLVRVKELYYGGDDSGYVSYVSNDNVLIRKLSLKYESTGEAVVDGGKGSVKDLIQPTPTNSNAQDIIWGRPKQGDVFE